MCVPLSPPPLPARSSRSSKARQTPPRKGARSAFSWTPKRTRFCEEYLVDLCGADAARRAGYSAKTAKDIAHELLAMPVISARIQELLTARSARTSVTVDYVLTRLRENVERAMQAEAVLDKLGNPTGMWTYEGAVANSALGLLGKHLGMFTEKVEHSGAIASADLTKDMTPQQRRDAIRALLATAAARA